MGLRDVLASADPDVDFHQWCLDNIGALFDAVVGGDSSLMDSVFAADGVPAGDVPEGKPVHSSFSFDIGRVYLRKNQVTSFHYTVGTGYWYMLQDIGTGDPDYRLKGYATPRPMLITGFRMWCRPSSNNTNLKFKVHVIRQRKTSGSQEFSNQVFKSIEFHPLTTDPFEVAFDIDDMKTESGDIVSLAFERIGTGGSGTFLLYPDSTTVITRELP